MQAWLTLRRSREQLRYAPPGREVEGGGKKKRGKGASDSKRGAGGESAAVSGRDGDEGLAASGDGAKGDGSMTASTIVDEKPGTDSDGHGDPPGDSGGSKTVGSSEADRAGQS